MIRIFALAAAAFLAACSSAPAPQAAGPLLGGVTLSCNASEAQICPVGGCGAGGGEPYQVPVSLTVPARSEVGSFCIATGCEDARYRAVAAPAAGWTASVATGPGWSEPVGEVTISPDRASFRLTQASANSVTVWTGFCNASGS